MAGYLLKAAVCGIARGGVEVDIVASAVPALYGCKTEAELKEQLAAQSLTSVKTRMNARGVLRLENGVAKRYVMEVESCK